MQHEAPHGDLNCSALHSQGPVRMKSPMGIRTAVVSFRAGGADLMLSSASFHMQGDAFMSYDSLWQTEAIACHRSHSSVG